MKNLVNISYNVFSLVLLITIGCNQPGLIDQASKIQRPTNARPQQTISTNSSAEKFLEVHQLGKNITLAEDFDNFLGNLPKGKEKSRIYLVRIDDFALGTAYNNLDKMDGLKPDLSTGFLTKVL